MLPYSHCICFDGYLWKNKTPPLCNVDVLDLKFKIGSDGALSLDIEWATFTDTCKSDHFPIILSIGAVNLCDNNFVPLCKYRCEGVSWDNFTLQASINVNGDDVNNIYTNVKNSILEAADSTLPKVPLYRTRVLVPWWQPECRQVIRMRNAAYRHYRQFQTPENYAGYKQ